MSDHHKIDLVVKSDGTIDTKVHWNRQVPNLIERYPEDIQDRVQSVFWLPDRYERQLQRKARRMPYFARATMQQLIYQQRAEKMSAERYRREKIKQRRAARWLSRLDSARRIWREVDRVNAFLRKSLGIESAKADIQATMDTDRLPSPSLAEEGARNPELQTPEPDTHPHVRPMGLIERFAREHTALQAVPLPEHMRDRSRSR